MKLQRGHGHIQHRTGELGGICRVEDEYRQWNDDRGHSKSVRVCLEKRVAQCKHYQVFVFFEAECRRGASTERNFRVVRLPGWVGFVDGFNGNGSTMV